tara:strand:- start:458 stop:751 length:294 start_codon:yes stop_codon:yes gene_type:complete
MIFDGKNSDRLMDEAYEVYSEILSRAIQRGTLDDPLKMVGLFLGLNIAENIMYQKLVDSGCTIESIEESKQKVSRISQKIIAQVKGKLVIPDSEDNF